MDNFVKKKELSGEYREYILKYYPFAVRGDIVTEEGNKILRNQNFTDENTIFGTSCCPDEINEFVTNFKLIWGNKFPLAGLAGIPFVGISGFNAFADHRPDNGNLFILFASHIGIDEQGNLGTILRKGISRKTTTCGSTITAYNLLMDEEYAIKVHQQSDEWDLQQRYMETIVGRSLQLIKTSPEPMVTLTDVVYAAIAKKIQKIIPNDFQGNIALLGGIQINTSLDFYDYFSFKEFKIINPMKKTDIDLQNDLLQALLKEQ